MKSIQPDLWETEVQYPMPGLATHAYLLIRNTGNVLFYNTGHRHEIESMAALGGVARQYLSHRDELGESINAIRERFGTRLGGHRLEYDDFARIHPPDIVFDKRDTDPDGIEIIPTPGHTPGSTCFLVNSTSGGRYLFTGDTLFLNNDGIWKAGYIDGISDREALAASLEQLRPLEPDLVVSSACPGGAGVRAIEPAQWPAHVERARSELLR